MCNYSSVYMDSESRKSFHLPLSRLPLIGDPFFSTDCAMASTIRGYDVAKAPFAGFMACDAYTVEDEHG